MRRRTRVCWMVELSSIVLPCALTFRGKVSRLTPRRLGGQWPNAGLHAQPFAPAPERLHALPARPLHGPLEPGAAPLGPGAARVQPLCAPAARRIAALAWPDELPPARPYGSRARPSALLEPLGARERPDHRWFVVPGTSPAWLCGRLRPCSGVR